MNHNLDHNAASMLLCMKIASHSLCVSLVLARQESNQDDYLRRFGRLRTTIGDVPHLCTHHSVLPRPTLQTAAAEPNSGGGRRLFRRETTVSISPDTGVASKTRGPLGSDVVDQRYPSPRTP